MSKLILFTNSFPYLPGETFLEEELPFLASKFSSIVIYPLYINSKESKRRTVPENVVVKDPLISFSHKDKARLLFNGIIPRSFAVQIKEFFSKRVFLQGKKLWIYLNYTLLYNSILSNTRIINSAITELQTADIAYFYWGDKSALLTSFLKKKASKPKYIVRFHGSDLYLTAKGFLPYREGLFSNIDYAIPISEHGAKYIQDNYGNLIDSSRIVPFRLGSFNEGQLENAEARKEKIIGEVKENNVDKVFKIISCSNVIELKRVELIAKALLNISEDSEFCKEMNANGFNKIEWNHIGDGPLLPEIKEICNKAILGKSYLKINFTGSLNHKEVLNLYKKESFNLFVMASRSEGIPVSIMEAFSFGVPVIATNVGGVSELFGGSISNSSNANIAQCKYGTLLPANLTTEELEESLTNAIKSFILLPMNKQSLAKKAARAEWEANWNGAKNYGEFSEFLQKNCGIPKQ